MNSKFETSGWITEVVRVTIHPVLYFPVSRVSKKISVKDDMECIAILRDS